MFRYENFIIFSIGKLTRFQINAILTKLEICYENFITLENDLNLNFEFQEKTKKKKQYRLLFQYFLGYLRDVDQQQDILRSDVDMSTWRRALLKVQQALIAAQEIGDEKLQIVQQVQDHIENKSRQLDLDYRNLGETRDTLFCFPQTRADCLISSNFSYLSCCRFW